MSQTRTVTVPANGKIVEFADGRFFNCISASAAGVVVYSGPVFGEVPIATGRRFGHEQAVAWRSLTFRNTTGADIDVHYYSGLQPYQSEQNVAEITTPVVTTVKDAATYTKDGSAPANATTTFNGLDAGKTRKQIIVANDEPIAGGQTIRVKSNAGTGIPLGPQEKFTLITSGTVRVTVPAGAQPAQVLETFYS